MVPLLAVSVRLAWTERVGSDTDTTRRRGPGLAGPPRGEPQAKLDPDRPDPKQSSERLEPEPRLGPATLADRRRPAPIRHLRTRRRRLVGASPVRGGCHVRGKGGRGDARAGSEHASGGLGGEAFEREGEFGNFARGDGKWEEEEGEERGGREREVRRVSENEERQKGKKAEEGESVGHGLHCRWAHYFRGFLVVSFVQIERKTKLTAIIKVVVLTVDIGK